MARGALEQRVFARPGATGCGPQRIEKDEQWIRDWKKYNCKRAGIFSNNAR